MTKDNVFANLPAALPAELFEVIVETRRAKIERILSRGHSSPLDCWYDQEQHEWVIVLQGSAGILFKNEEQPRVLRAGDYLNIPAHRQHRVAWTDSNQVTIWLAVHYS